MGGRGEGRDRRLVAASLEQTEAPDTKMAAIQANYSFTCRSFQVSRIVSQVSVSWKGVLLHWPKNNNASYFTKSSSFPGKIQTSKALFGQNSPHQCFLTITVFCVSTPALNWPEIWKKKNSSGNLHFVMSWRALIPLSGKWPQPELGVGSTLWWSCGPYTWFTSIYQWGYVIEWLELDWIELNWIKIWMDFIYNGTFNVPGWALGSTGFALFILVESSANWFTVVSDTIQGHQWPVFHILICRGAGGEYRVLWLFSLQCNAAYILNVVPLKWSSVQVLLCGGGSYAKPRLWR